MPRCLSRRHLLKSWGTAGAAVFVGSVLQACQVAPPSGQPTVPAAPGGPTREAGAQPGATAAPQPKKGGTLNVGLPVDPGTMDTRLQNDTSAANINDLCYSGLVYIDQDLVPRPDLATSWENPDPTTWVFHLRQGVTFHDGSPFTAADVKFTLETMVDPAFKSPRRSLYAPIMSVDAVDDHTARINLSEPYAPLLAYLDVGIVSRTHTEKAGSALGEAPMGTGPFKFVRWDKGNRITLEASDRYYKGRPHLDEVVLHIIPDNTVRAVGLESGTLDLIQSPLAGQDVKRLKGDPKIAVTQATGLGITYLNLNTVDPVLADKRVRQALALLTDRHTIASTIYEDMDQPGVSSLIPGTWWWDDSVQGYGYDPARARELLAQAGWTPGPDGILAREGQRLALSLTTYNDPNRMQLQQFLQNGWRQVGIEVQPGVSEWPPFIANVQAGNYQVAIIGWLILVDPDRAFYRQFSSGGDSNWGKYQNEQVDQLLRHARSVSDEAARRKDYAEAARLILDDAPYVYVTYQGYAAMTRSVVHDFVVNRSQSIKGIEKAWLG
jgi:peptide/nickel transport system substrate-binding protein